jgi:transposase
MLWFSDNMGKIADITPRKSAKIAVLLQETSFSQRQIAEKLFVSQSTVRRISDKFKRGMDLAVKRAGKCGRKRITTSRDDRKIQKTILKNRKAPTSRIKLILEQEGVVISQRTLRRRSVEMGFTCCRPRRKPKLTPAMIKKRLSWAREHSKFTLQDWNTVSAH